MELRVQSWFTRYLDTLEKEWPNVGPPGGLTLWHVTEPQQSLIREAYKLSGRTIPSWMQAPDELQDQLYPNPED